MLKRLLSRLDNVRCEGPWFRFPLGILTFGGIGLWISWPMLLGLYLCLRFSLNSETAWPALWAILGVVGQLVWCYCRYGEGPD